MEEEMPRRDGTGPMGQGAFTGRGMGGCQTVDANKQNTGFYGRMRSFLGFPCGRGQGRRCSDLNRGGFSGRNRQRNFIGVYTDNQMMDEGQQIEMLKRQKERYETDLKRINQELDKYKEN